MGTDPGTVECVTHGAQPATYVCRHVVETLRDGRARGFWCAHDPGNPRPDAWCSDCEARLQQTGGEWNEENGSMAGVTLLCAACYDRAREINLASGRGGEG